MFFHVDPKAIRYKCLLFLILCCLCGLLIAFRQQSVPAPIDAPNAAPPVSVDDTTGDVMPTASHLPSHPQTSADSIDRDFYQTIIRKNLFAPLGTVFSAEPEPGRHLTLVGTFVSEDPSASSVLIKNTTTGRHHLLSVGEGVDDFHVLAVAPKHVRFYHHGTEVKLHLSESENLFLNTNRR